VVSSRLHGGEPFIPGESLRLRPDTGARNGATSETLHPEYEGTFHSFVGIIILPEWSNNRLIGVVITLVDWVRNMTDQSNSFRQILLTVNRYTARNVECLASYATIYLPTMFRGSQSIMVQWAE